MWNYIPINKLIGERVKESVNPIHLYYNFKRNTTAISTVSTQLKNQ